MEKWVKMMLYGVATMVGCGLAVWGLQLATAIMHEQVHSYQYTYLGYENTSTSLNWIGFGYTQNYDAINQSDKQLIYLASMMNEAEEYNNLGFQQLVVALLTLQTFVLLFIAYKAGRKRKHDNIVRSVG